MKKGSRLLNTSVFGWALWEQQKYALEEDKRDLARASDKVRIFFPEDFPSTCVKRERCNWDFCDDPRFCSACIKDVYCPLVAHDEVIARETCSVFESVKVIVGEEVHPSEDVGNENEDSPVKVEQAKKRKKQKAEPLLHEEYQPCPAEMMQFGVPVEFAH